MSCTFFIFCDYICAFVIRLFQLVVVICLWPHLVWIPMFKSFLLLIQLVVLICLLAHQVVRDYTQLAIQYLGCHFHRFLVVLLLSHMLFQLVDLLVLVVEVQLGATFPTNKPPSIMLELLALT